jgi:hypothetical protein
VLSSKALGENLNPTPRISETPGDPAEPELLKLTQRDAPDDPPDDPAEARRWFRKNFGWEATCTSYEDLDPNAPFPDIDKPGKPFISIYKPLATGNLRNQRECLEERNQKHKPRKPQKIPWKAIIEKCTTIKDVYIAIKKVILWTFRQDYWIWKSH